MRRRLLAVALAAGWLAAPAMAHEFWIEAVRSAPREHRLHLFVGEHLAGDRVAWVTAHAAAFRLHGVKAQRDLLDRVPATGLLPEFALALPAGGSHVVAYDSHPSEVTLEAGQFHAYLRDEGLEAIVARREAQGTAKLAARERFRRSAKLLLRGDGRSDGAALQPTGQRIEILPLDDPLAARPGQRLRFEVRWQGRPLPGVLLRALHRREDGQTWTLRARADEAGRVRIALPFGGFWLLNAVHMTPAAGGSEPDWDSDWASLGFELAR